MKCNDSPDDLIIKTKIVTNEYVAGTNNTCPFDVRMLFAKSLGYSASCLSQYLYIPNNGIANHSIG